jgi:hypothetical protein
MPQQPREVLLISVWSYVCLYSWNNEKAGEWSCSTCVLCGRSTTACRHIPLWVNIRHAHAHNGNFAWEPWVGFCAYLARKSLNICQVFFIKRNSPLHYDCWRLLLNVTKITWNSIVSSPRPYVSVVTLRTALSCRNCMLQLVPHLWGNWVKYRHLGLIPPPEPRTLSQLAPDLSPT